RKGVPALGPNGCPWLVGPRLQAQLGARAVVDDDDLAANLGTLADGGRPRDAEGALLATDGVGPAALVFAEIDHGRGLRGAVAERPRDEEVVVSVVIVHVMQHGGDDLGGEAWH